MPTQLLFTRFLNHHLAGQVNLLLSSLHIHPQYPQAPITNAFAMEVLVFLTLLAYFLWVRASLSVEKPTTVQHFAEMTHEFVTGQSESIIGHGYERFTSYITTLALFILLCNLLGLVPGFESPTASYVVPLGCAIMTFVYYNYHGIRANGFLGFLRSFAGPVWWMAWLIFPIEVVSNLARILSLTVRLYANMFASDMMTLVAFSGFPVGLPVLALGLHFFVSLIQAFVFMLLTMIYLSLAVAHEH